MTLLFSWSTRMRYSFQSTRLLISYRNEPCYRVYMIPVRIVVSLHTGTKLSYRYKNRSELVPVWLVPVRHFVSCNYKYRATSGNRDGLVPEWKSYRYHVNTTLRLRTETRYPHYSTHYSTTIPVIYASKSAISMGLLIAEERMIANTASVVRSWWFSERFGKNPHYSVQFINRPITVCYFNLRVQWSNVENTLSVSFL